MSLILVQPTDCYLGAWGMRTVFYVSTVSGCTYTWQYSTDNGQTFTNTGSSNLPTYVIISNVTQQQTRVFRCIVSKAGESEISNIVRARLFPAGSEQTTMILQRNNSENNKLDKNVELVKSVAGYMREETSIISPVLMIEAPLDEVAAANYITIPAFGRSYFIENIETVTTKLQRVTARCDVISSFADEIKANKGIVRRAESANAYNLYINDNSLVAYQDPYILTEPFPNGFTGTAFILAVAGA